MMLHFLKPSVASITIEEALKRDKNNFDLFRLIAALLVIYGHSFALAPAPDLKDVFFVLTGYNSAAIAVKFFFFLSGLLVTDSLLKRGDVIQFLIARFFRIWPALGFVLIVSALIIGPLVTNLGFENYFSNPDVYRYIKRQLMMRSWGTQSLGFYNLPGVFLSNPYEQNVNASLWSLIAEIYAYLFLLAAFCIGLMQRKIFALLFGLILLDSLVPTRLIFTFLPQGNEDFSYLPFCFAIGTFCAVFKDKVRISIGIPLGCLLFVYLLDGNPIERYFFYITIFSSVLYFATRSWIINKIRLPMDVSYGVFLWGFPIQQALVYLFPNIRGLTHCLLAMLIAIFMGVVSWILVEKRSIELGKKIQKYL